MKVWDFDEYAFNRTRGLKLAECPPPILSEIVHHVVGVIAPERRLFTVEVGVEDYRVLREHFEKWLGPSRQDVRVCGVPVLAVPGYSGPPKLVKASDLPLDLQGIL